MVKHHKRAPMHEHRNSCNESNVSVCLKNYADVSKGNAPWICRTARLLLERTNSCRCASWHPKVAYSGVWMTGESPGRQLLPPRPSGEAQKPELSGQTIFLLSAGAVRSSCLLLHTLTVECNMQ